MKRILFCDGEKIGCCDGDKITYYESDYIRRYREYAISRNKNDEWKFSGEGARFRGDYDTYRFRESEKITAYINGVQAVGDDVIYTFTVNGSSGIYKKSLINDKLPEEHMLSSSEEEYLSLQYNNESGEFAVTVRRDQITSQVALFQSSSSCLTTLTDGDARDENISYSETEAGVVYFDSAGAGRTAEGEFTGKYAPSEILRLDSADMRLTTVLSDEKYSYIKPKMTKDGLYCIRRPTKEKKGGNPILEILLIPVRIFQAIVMFIQAFVRLFTGKSLTSAGDNPTKGRENDSRKLFVDGNLIQAEKEYKRNQKFKDREYGFIPHSWQLMRFKDGAAETLASGVCDFDIDGDGTLCYTDGRHVFSEKSGKRKKIADTAMCLCVKFQKS